MQHILIQVDRNIQSIIRVLSQTPDDSPNLRLLLLCLANAHNERFDLRRELNDIQKVIEYRTIVLTRTPDDDSSLPHLLSKLGIAHGKRFQRLGDKDDIEKSIEFQLLAFELIPEGHPDLPRYLSNLGMSHKARFEQLGELGDIEKAIDYDSRVLEITPEDDSSLPDRLDSLGTSHGYRFQQSDDLNDLENSIEYLSRALSSTPDNHPHLASRLSNLATSQSRRFQLLGELSDLQQAIEYQSRSVALTPENHPGLSSYLGNLAASHRQRFTCLRDPGDLGQAIEYGSRAIALTPDDHPHFSIHLASLAMSHKVRFQCLGELRDLEQAIEYESRALELTPTHHPAFAGLLSDLALSHNHRFKLLREPSDLEQAIKYDSRALDLIPDDHPDLSSGLGNLAVSHKDRFERLGELHDLEQAIEFGSRAVALGADNHPHFACRVSNLGKSYEARFERLGELRDLEHAIEHGSRALALTPGDDPELSTHLSNLSVSHSVRFEHLGELHDLEHAINYGSRALVLTPEEGPAFPYHLTNLAVFYIRRFRCLGELHDLEQAIDHLSRALDFFHGDHPDVPTPLVNLASAHTQRFERLGELSDLKQAIDYESRALAVIAPDHPKSCLWHYNHAMSYIRYYQYSHNNSHLQQSLPLFRTASTLPTGPPRDKFKHAHQWASLASKHTGLDPIEAYQTTIDLLPQYIWLGAASDQRYQDLKSVKTLAVDAAQAAVISFNYPLALEWLEHARCVVWNQNLMIRSPLDQLLASHPALATRLQTVSDQLHIATSNSRESLAHFRSITSEQVAQDHRRLAEEYEGLLTKARIQPGFEDFLRPIKVDKLICAARSGPIVVINCHESRCDAILVLPRQSTVTHLCLPSFSSKKAQDARSTIQSVLSRQGIRERKFYVRQEQGRHNNSDFGNVLKMLWIDVVKPILDSLGYTTRPLPGILPHITWCPTGIASFLPLHAAGDYDQQHLRIFDYAVSSYTPTLSALLNSNTSTLDCNSRVLAVGQAATPDHAPLPGTTTELEYVKSSVEKRAGYSELMDAEATPETVLDAMEKHDWVHLACHAHQNVYDPTKSGFFLHGGTLDLAAINRRSFKKKGLAFLSACQTATGDETLPDEAVHLASGMLMAGYSSVIATMWSVGDAEAPFVADKVYNQLMKQGTLGNGEAGRALHYAVEELRMRVGEREFGRWVPFIHIGS